MLWEVAVLDEEVVWKEGKCGRGRGWGLDNGMEFCYIVSTRMICIDKCCLGGAGALGRQVWK